MGEDLSQPERTAIRTPMQWSATPNSGFSNAEPSQLITPLVEDEYGYRKVNVTDQRRDPDSLLVWFELMLHTRRECAEIGIGRHRVIDTGPAHVLVHRADAPGGAVLFVHNLAEDEVTVSLPPDEHTDEPVELFHDRDYGDLDLDRLQVGRYGYRWIRLRRNHARTGTT